jgi:hypothetical protein
MRCWHLCAICNIFGLQFHLTSLIIIFYFIPGCYVLVYVLK